MYLQMAIIFLCQSGSFRVYGIWQNHWIHWNLIETTTMPLLMYLLLWCDVTQNFIVGEPLNRNDSWDTIGKKSKLIFLIWFDSTYSEFLRTVVWKEPTIVLLWLSAWWVSWRSVVILGTQIWCQLIEVWIFGKVSSKTSLGNWKP